MGLALCPMYLAEARRRVAVRARRFVGFAAVVAVILFFTIQSAVKRRRKARRCRKWKTQ